MTVERDEIETLVFNTPVPRRLMSTVPKVRYLKLLPLLICTITIARFPAYFLALIILMVVTPAWRDTRILA